MTGGPALQVLFCGVGGQGVLRAAELLGRALFAAGQQVTVGQLHGMSQRGGSVSSFVIVGDTEAALLDGAPDVLVALEPLEGARAAPGLARQTTVLLNTHQVVPYERTRLGQGYPDPVELHARIAARAGRVLSADVTAALAAVGLERAVGVAMLGALWRLGTLDRLGVPKDVVQAELGSADLGSADDARRAFALGADLAFSSTNTSQETGDGLQARH